MSADPCDPTGSIPCVKGLTVVSDQAVYVRGNYNTTDKKPASFLVDSFNVLSTNWDQGLSTSSPYDGRNYDTSNLPNLTTTMSSDRVAASTTFNAAVLAGTDTTGGEEGVWRSGGKILGMEEGWLTIHASMRTGQV